MISHQCTPIPLLSHPFIPIIHSCNLSTKEKEKVGGNLVVEAAVYDSVSHGLSFCPHFFTCNIQASDFWFSVSTTSSLGPLSDTLLLPCEIKLWICRTGSWNNVLNLSHLYSSLYLFSVLRSFGLSVFSAHCFRIEHMSTFIFPFSFLYEILRHYANLHKKLQTFSGIEATHSITGLGSGTL